MNPLEASYFRALDWRWQEALHLVERGRRLLRGSADAETLAAARFARAWHGCATAVERRQCEKDWSTYITAHHLYEHAGPKGWEIEGRLLAGQEDQAIAERCGLHPQTVRRYEALFFNIRGRLHARDWISSRVIGSGLRNGFPKDDLRGLWQAYGYSGGVRVLEVVIAVSQEKPLPEWACAVTAEQPHVDEAALRQAIMQSIEAMRVHPKISWVAMAEMRRSRHSQGEKQTLAREKLLGPMGSLLDIKGMSEPPS